MIHMHSLETNYIFSQLKTITNPKSRHDAWAMHLLSDLLNNTCAFVIHSYHNTIQMVVALTEITYLPGKVEVVIGDLKVTHRPGGLSCKKCVLQSGLA